MDTMFYEELEKLAGGVVPPHIARPIDSNFVPLDKNGNKIHTYIEHNFCEFIITHSNSVIDITELSLSDRDTLAGGFDGIMITFEPSLFEDSIVWIRRFVNEKNKGIEITMDNLPEVIKTLRKQQNYSYITSSVASSKGYRYSSIKDFLSQYKNSFCNKACVYNKLFCHCHIN